jgi:hypothetical protein
VITAAKPLDLQGLPEDLARDLVEADNAIARLSTRADAEGFATLDSLLPTRRQLQIAVDADAHERLDRARGMAKSADWRTRFLGEEMGA